MVVDGLRINDSISETFAIYIPTTYSNEKVFPVIFVFDPEGRGRTVAQLFRQAAEVQGYIIAASNNINAKDSLLNNLKVGTRLMSRVFDLFNIDKNRIYTAGFGIGAQVASAIPAFHDDINGVLAVGDIWLNPDFVKKDKPMSVLGLVGTRDVMLYSMEESFRFLSRTKHPAILYKFDGSHEWPNSNIISHAIGNFTLQAMHKGLIPQNPALTESLYAAEIQTAERLRRSLQFYRSYEFLEQMETKYALFNKKGDLKKWLKALKQEKPFKDQRAQYNRASVKGSELKEQYMYYFNADVLSSNWENLGWWAQQIKEMKAFQESKDLAEVEMGYRMEGFLRSMAKNTFAEFNAAEAHIDILIFTAILQTIFDKENPEGYFSIISLSARDGDYDTSLLYLEDLLKTGYKDIDALYAISGTLDLKLSPEYNLLIKKYLGESRFYNN